MSMGCGTGIAVCPDIDVGLHHFDKQNNSSVHRGVDARAMNDLCIEHADLTCLERHGDCFRVVEPFWNILTAGQDALRVPSVDVVQCPCLVRPRNDLEASMLKRAVG